MKTSSFILALFLSSTCYAQEIISKTKNKEITWLRSESVFTNKFSVITGKLNRKLSVEFEGKEVMVDQSSLKFHLKVNNGSFSLTLKDPTGKKTLENYSIQLHP